MDLPYLLLMLSIAIQVVSFYMLVKLGKTQESIHFHLTNWLDKNAQGIDTLSKYVPFAVNSAEQTVKRPHGASEEDFNNLKLRHVQDLLVAYASYMNIKVDSNLEIIIRSMIENEIKERNTVKLYGV